MTSPEGEVWKQRAKKELLKTVFFLFKKEEKLTLSVLMFTFRPFVLFLSAGGVEGPVFTQSSIDGDQYFDIFRYIDALTRLKWTSFPYM